MAQHVHHPLGNKLVHRRFSVAARITAAKDFPLDLMTRPLPSTVRETHALSPCRTGLVHKEFMLACCGDPGETTLGVAGCE